jgi:hypothetical protein
MAGNKKSRVGKKRKDVDLKIPKLFNVISIRQEDPSLSMQIYGGIAGFLAEPSLSRFDGLCEIVNTMALSYCIQRQAQNLADLKDRDSVVIVSFMNALLDIRDRAGRTGVWGVSKTEQMTIKAAAGGLDEALGNIGVALWNQAKALQRQRTAELAIAVNKIVHQIERDEKMMEAA